MQRVRFWVQALWFFLSNGYWGFPFSGSLYQGPLKALCAPGLNCYSCPAATTFCLIGALQQVLMGLRLGLQTGQAYFGAYVLGCLGLLATLFGRMICGWACPFGLFQELLHKLPSRKFSLPPMLRWGKYAVLALLVVLLPVSLIDAFGLGAPWFCKLLCPAGTLEAGLPMLLLMPDLRPAVGWLYVNKVVLLIGFMVASIFLSRPFCRIACPLGAFYGLFHRVSLIRLKFVPDNCTKCGACHRVCPVELRFDQTPDSAECIRCLRCSGPACPTGAIMVEIAGHRVTSAPARPVNPVEQPPRS